MISSIIHHLGIAVSDPPAAGRFFDLLLVEYLGMVKEEVWEACAGWKGRGSRIYLYPREGDGPGTLQHLAFTARSREEVARFFAWAKSKGIAVLGGPYEYPEYGGDYFAVFFEGPDGLKLELVHLTEGDGAAVL